MVVEVGLANTVEPVVDDKVADAELPFCKVHEYVFAPEAVSTALSPEQMVALFTVIVGPDFMVTATEPEAEHPVVALVTVT